MRVEVVFALADRQQVVVLELASGATALSAVQASGLQADAMALAVFGRKVRANRILEDGDRVEILRPLAADPREARRRRAKRGGGRS